MGKRNKTDNAKPDKPDRPGKGLLGPDDIIFRSASIKPNTWRPKYVYRRREEGEGEEEMMEGDRGRREDQRAFRIHLSSFYFKRQ